MEFLRHKLNNGLEIIAEINPRAYSTAFAFLVNTGSRDENDVESGVSHFLEHMVFKGTPTRSAEAVNRELDEIGSQSNAFTSEEQTVYYLAVLPEYQERAVHLLADIMRPSLRADDFNVEKQVILEEIKKYEDEPPFGAFEKSKEVHFGDHPLARSVLGTSKSVSDMTPEQMREYFERRYTPANMVLAATGDVDFDLLVADAERICGKWASVAAGRKTPRAAACQQTELVTRENAYQEYVIQMANGPAAEDDDRFAARILATALGDDSGSRFFWDLIDSGLAEYASMSNYEYQGTGVFLTYLCCEPDQVQRNLQLIRDAEQRVQDHGITSKELEIARNKICSHVVLQSERPINRLFSVGNHWIQRREYRTVRQIVDAYSEISLDNVQAVLQKYPLTECTTVGVGPLDQLES